MAIALAAAALASGCDRDPPRPPPESPQQAAAARGVTAPALPPPGAEAPPASGTPAGDANRMSAPGFTAVAAGGRLAWTLPEGWTEEAGSGVRYATIVAGEVEIAVTTFPGDVGGLLANVNRWRAQVGLGPIEADALPQATQAVTRDDGEPATIVEIAGAEGTTLLAAVVPSGGQTWFLKATASAERIAGIREAFAALVRSVRPSAS